jgi:hypothetical protein
VVLLRAFENRVRGGDMGPLGFTEFIFLGVFAALGLAVVGSMVYAAVRLANQHDNKNSN